MLKNVVAVAIPGVHPFELGVACEVFGIDRGDHGLPVYDFALATYRPGRVRTNSGFSIDVEHGVDRIAQADLVVVPASGDHDRAEPLPDSLLQALRDTVDRGGRVLSVCSGAFVLGEAGLLDGRRCTTHWMYAQRLAREYPRALVQPDVLYVEDSGVVTGAGTAAGIDASLHIVRQEDGSRVANAIARRMVVPPHRDGGQAQYIARPLPAPEESPMQATLDWLQNSLADEVTIEQMAAHALMSPRTFARKFQQETGTTPYEWLTAQRVLAAQELLEETDMTVDAVASRTGFGSAATLRHHFLKRRGTTPQAYRRVFRGAA
ncbi:GlxA family transcriptional regulator [Yinghuangia soli]|uniref:Helix-turn-helix domain-containing protein n=1 Tax=Yinghuangia soli TaxID=2908204 RepID=A0AA41U360_9ACTN|nr:helix-turn-helix domain-containing protein [Yinghuangia soli]MCF2527759.1 helix-turn-helix domain-containing protein [Yinghuangia soli]